ncbi:MAG: SelL-related redox protein [Chitinophagales bacterium]
MNVIQNRNSSILKAILYIAGLYHLVWAIVAIASPKMFFIIANLQLPTYIETWQLIGLYTGILGIGYWMAASNPIRNWRIVAMGFSIKLIVVLCFVNSVFHHTENSIVYKMILLNHVVWLPLFAVILYNAYKHQFLLDNELIRMNHLSTDELLEMYTTNQGNTVNELAEHQPVLLVFLRHFGCTFCKETLLNIQKYKTQIENQGTKIVLVNMQETQKSIQELAKYNLQHIEYISDQESLLYKAFKLKRGSITQVLGFKVWLRGIYLWITKGAFITSPDGADVYQMPGVFLIYKGAVVKQFIHRSAADNPSYLDLATCDTCVAV